MTIEAREVLVLDSSTFIREIGLMSQKGSALKHYLYCRGTQLVVPQAAAEECERNLTQMAKGKIGQIQKELRWLAQFWAESRDGRRQKRTRSNIGRGPSLQETALEAFFSRKLTIAVDGQSTGTRPNCRQAT